MATKTVDTMAFSKHMFTQTPCFSSHAPFERPLSGRPTVPRAETVMQNLDKNALDLACPLQTVFAPACVTRSETSPTIKNKKQKMSRARITAPRVVHYASTNPPKINAKKTKSPSIQPVEESRFIILKSYHFRQVAAGSSCVRLHPTN